MPIYIKFDGVDGEVTQASHDKWIEVLSCSLGMAQAGGGFSGGGGSGKVSFQDISCVSPVGKGSPTLMLACCKGTHFQTVKLEITKASPGGAEQSYSRFTLEDCVITSFQLGGDAGGSIPIESYSFNYQRIQYNQLVPGGFEEIFWDRRSNQGGGGQL